MDPATFRRDPFLRSSAYHLATWSLTALVLDFQLGRLAAGDPTATATLVVLVAGGALTSMTHERRVGKIAGAAGEPVFAGARPLWRLALLLIAAGAVSLIASGRPQWVFPLWTGVAGAAFAYWGVRAEFGWYQQLGLALLAAGVADGLATMGGTPLFALRIVAMAIAIPAAALLTNRRYLWPR